MEILTFGQAVRDTCNIIKGAGLGTLFLLSTLLASAQVGEIVAAEKAFAQTSVDQNTRAAFLEFFTDSTLAFNGGQPSYGRKDWEKRPAGNGYLFWWPVYADVSASGDFGFTTGPAVFGPSKVTKEVKGGIYYSSVWKKNADGQWKVLADMGSAVYDTSQRAETFHTTKNPSKASDKKLNSLSGIDRGYNKKLNRNSVSFDASRFSDEGRIHRRSHPPITSGIKTFNETETRYNSFEHVGGEIASSNDMAFTYGVVQATVLKATVPSCYMRVWKLENGEWKIVLDVIGG